jgi:hypothetical protein
VVSKLVNAPFLRALLISACTIANAAAAEYSEMEVKAAFLYHFATYVEWPEPPHPDEPITIAVLNEPAIAGNLLRFVQGRSVQGRTVRVRSLTTLDDFPRDEILFIGDKPTRRLARLITSIDSPTLVVTDAPAGLPEGAMINFRIVDQRVRFEISLPAARNAGLTLSSRLLAAALRVETTRCHESCGLPYARVVQEVALGT